MKLFKRHLDIILEAITRRHADAISLMLNSKKLKTLPTYQKLLDLRQEEQLDTDLKVINYLCSFDPTAENQAEYASWIFRTFMADKYFKLPEDGIRVFNALSKFRRVRELPNYDQEKDLGQIKTLDQLEQIVRKYPDVKQDVDSITSWDNYVKEQKEALLSLIFEDDVYKMYVLNPTPANIRAITTKRGGAYGTLYPINILPSQEVENLRMAKSESNAMGRIGEEYDLSISAFVLSEIARGQTDWCVAHTPTAEYYLEQGPMLIGYKYGNICFLINTSFDQFMNIRDKLLATPLTTRYSWLPPSSAGAPPFWLGFFFCKVLIKVKQLPDWVKKGLIACVRDTKNKLVKARKQTSSSIYNLPENKYNNMVKAMDEALATH